MIKQIFYAVILGVICYFALGVFPYFPAEWMLVIAVGVLIAAYFQPELAIFLIVGTFGVSMAYHSTELFILFLSLFLVVRFFMGEFTRSPEMFSLIVGAPVLANVTVGGVEVPLETSVIFLTAVLLYRERILIMAAVACFFTAVAGIIGNQSQMGYLLLGNPSQSFVQLGVVKTDFYDFSWIKDQLYPELLMESLQIGQQLITTLIRSPFIAIQVVAWAVVSYLIAFAIDFRIHRNSWWLDLFVIAAVTGILGFAQSLTLHFYPYRINFNFVPYLSTISVIGAAFFMIWEVQRWIEKRRLYERMKPTKEYIKESLQSPASVKTKGLSLQETLKIQAELQAHIQKKFTHEVTALDIDIAGSTKMKEGEPSEKIIASFTEYWKYVDVAVLARGGRLLNRAGDGAVYIFEDPDRGVSASREILSGLERFNKKYNTLKTPFAIRIGLNSGEMMQDTTQRGGDVFSRVIDVAAHLQKMAGPLQVVVSEHTYQQLKRKKGFELGGTSEQDNVQYYMFNDV